MRTYLRTSLFALALVGGAAQAHNPWLLPSSTVLSKPDWVTVDAAVSTTAFVTDHQPMRLENLQVTGPDGGKVDPQSATTGKLRSTFDLELKQPGTYRIAVLNEGAFARWKDAATGQQRRARVNAADIATQIPADAKEVEITQSMGRIETFVTVGKPSALKPSGKGLELLATGGPIDLVKGEKARFELRVDGQPAPDVEVTVTPGNARYRDSLGDKQVRTDAQGRLEIDWPQAGMYWVDATVIDKKTTLPRASQRRLTYAATFEVLP